VNPFLSDFRMMDLRAIAVRHSFGYVFEALRVLLVSSQTRSVYADLPKSKDVCAIHAIWDVERLHEFLAMLVKGEVELNDTLIHVKRRISPDKWVPLDSIYFRRYDRTSSNARFGLDCLCISLEAFDSSHISPDERAGIDDILRCQEKPWDGIDDLRTTFANQSRSWGQNMSFLEVIAPIGVRFDGKAVVENAQLHIGATKSAWMGGKDLSVASLVKTRRTIHRSNWPIRAISVYKKKRRQPISIPLPSQYEWVKCMLMYRGSEVDRYELYRSKINETSQEWRVFSELTGGIEQLEDLSHGHPLETNLEVLFHLLGFETVHYGGRDWPTRKSTPDIVAFPKKGDWYLVVECTSRDTDLHNKLGILSTRSKELSRVTPESRVYPVIFTALSREIVNKTDIEKAAKEQISVITANELTKLLDAVRFRKDNEEVLRILQHQIPGMV